MTTPQQRKQCEKSPNTNAKRQADFRARKAENGLKEIRGIFASDENAVKIREFAAMLKCT